MTYPHEDPPRPIVDRHEQRWRWWVMRVDTIKQAYRYIADVERYDWACLWADTAVVQLGGDFIVWDSHERRALYDSRAMPGKWDPDRQRELAEHIHAVTVRLALRSTWQPQKTTDPGRGKPAGSVESRCTAGNAQGATDLPRCQPFPSLRCAPALRVRVVATSARPGTARGP